MNILEIGPGAQRIQGATHSLNVVPDGFSVVGNWGGERTLTSYFPCKFGGAFASHVLEHVPWFQTEKALKDLFDVLEQGAAVQIWVPNFDFIVKAFTEKRCGDSWRKHNPKGQHMKWVNGRIFTYGPGEENFHKAVFTPDYLCALMRGAGFTSVKTLSYKERKHGTPHGPMEFGVRAVKP